MFQGQLVLDYDGISDYVILLAAIVYHYTIHILVQYLTATLISGVMNLHRLQLHLCKVRSFKLDEVGIWCVSGIDGFKFKYMNRLLMLSTKLQFINLHFHGKDYLFK